MFLRIIKSLGVSLLVTVAVSFGSVMFITLLDLYLVGHSIISANPKIDWQNILISTINIVTFLAAFIVAFRKSGG